MLTMPATSSFVLRCATAVFAAVLLAGCTGEEAPSPTAAPTTPVASTPAASGSPTEAPTASSTAEPEIEKITTPPAVPVDLKTPGKVGSKAAVEYFVALYGYTLNTGDTSLLRAASTETCDYCRSLADGIDAEFDSGVQTAGDAATINVIRQHEGESTSSEHVWLMELHFAPYETLAADGASVESKGPREETLGLVAAWDGTRWRVADYVDVVELDRSS
ncbi:hypothetical protein ATL41_1712 [Flavimobilis soli]|uniref:DUF6318 domain-containing protein n=2 Tax=Flavimobilis soli TaxID=442709 RepID=A0A2A9EDG2_9MICO|nr:hypothetical protein ATL41_1712 [Flavimobilis soli]